MNIEEIKSYHQNHSDHDTAEMMGISIYKFKKWLVANNIPKHTVEENTYLSYQVHGNGFQKKMEREFQQLLESIDKEEFANYYYNNAIVDTLTKFNITRNQLNKILNAYDLRKLTQIESVNLNYIKKYGSVEDGKRITREKAKATCDKNNSIEKACQKRFETNQKRYGGKSPFSSEEIRKKRDLTVQEKYGVKNVFQADCVKQKIKDIQTSKYGGIGWQSEELRQKYIQIMQEKYGVDWGCMLPQCINANHGCNSKPNALFAKLLEENNISYEPEFCLENKRFDFKLSNNILIEVNPTYTHSVSTVYKNLDKNKKIDINYHLEKTQTALNNGYRCICIWDWDNVSKILSLLSPKQKIYARNCEIKIVDQRDSKSYIDIIHLQNYCKSDINIGLFYNNELVSIMTFGKPRYNKKCEYELLRYCSSYNVIGGAEKLFKYFLTHYNPQSIVSYCDLSKFSGDVYVKLGFTNQTSNLHPSKHWYNIKTKQHITDNLLRQHGFDQLFGTNYGKGTSNAELMLQNGFLEIYDCGQLTYVWNKE